MQPAHPHAPPPPQAALPRPIRPNPAAAHLPPLAACVARARLASARLAPMAEFFGATVPELARELAGMDEEARGRKRDEYLLPMGRTAQWRLGAGAAAMEE